MKKNIIYVDAENVTFQEFKEYYDSVLSPCNCIGKVYGNSDAIKNNINDYLRIGFEYYDTAPYNSSSKNVADMKIVTDCAFDVLRVFNPENINIELITKDCDFMPLVYKLLGIGVSVTVPMLGAAKSATPYAKIVESLEVNGYNPMLTEEWALPQADIIYNILHGDIDYNSILKYCKMKRTKFIHAVTVYDAPLAAELDKIPEATFCAKEVFAILRNHHCGQEELERYITLFTNKFFGKSFKTLELKRALHRLYA